MVEKRAVIQVDSSTDLTNNTIPENDKKKQNDTTEKAGIANELKLIIGVGGIFLCYLYFGIVQERVTKTKFGDEKFTYTFVLLFIQCIFCAITSGFQAFFLENNKQHTTPQYKFAIIAFSFLFAMFSSNSALYYVDYPTQVLAKTCKPIPVILMGVFYFKKKYTWYQWATVILIVTGITVFLFKDNVSNNKEYDLNYLFGVVLLIISLTFDGLTGPLQDNTFSLHKPSHTQMMYYNNLYAGIYCIIGMIVTGQAIEAYQFCERHPEILLDIVLFSMAGAVGQNFIYFTIFNFSSLLCTIVTTSRKFFTILASVIIFGNAITARQWFGVFLVFFGIGLETAITAYNKYRLTNMIQKKKN